MKVLFATTNPAKVKKYKKVLEEKGIKLITINDLDLNGHKNLLNKKQKNFCNSVSVLQKI